MHHKFIFGAIKSTGSRLVSATLTTQSSDRVGDIVRPRGLVNKADFLKTGTVIAFHDQSMPVAQPTAISIFADRIEGEAQFPPSGTSQNADEIYGLIKNRVINNVSIGFRVLESSPISGGGLDITKWELLEWSFVSVPANAEAVITARSLKAGRVLSGSNAGKLRQAHDAAEMCRGLVADVLGNAGETDGKAMSRAERERDVRMLELAGFRHVGDAVKTLSQREREMEFLRRNGSR
ncbi:HK97 family phage prohead protease [Bradyrhizobium sp. INPA03-11B]|uniref:HK97 family phage prohead protease n=1 Tax=Bradyrhizobium sp. INPA03-11B TaxID=418598 RepID=UPI00338E5F58